MRTILEVAQSLLSIDAELYFRLSPVRRMAIDLVFEAAGKQPPLSSDQKKEASVAKPKQEVCPWEKDIDTK